MTNQVLLQEYQNNRLLIEASVNGNVDDVKRLLFGSKTQVNHQALLWAAQKGHLDVVKLLLPVSDPQFNNSMVLRETIIKGHTEIVKLLIPVSDPKANDSQALRMAANYGYTEIVKLLIPVSDVKAIDSTALKWVLRSDADNIECVKLLIPHSDCNRVLMDTSLSDSECQLLQQCIDEYETLQQQKRLQTSVEPLLEEHHTTKRKM